MFITNLLPMLSVMALILCSAFWKSILTYRWDLLQGQVVIGQGRSLQTEREYGYIGY